MKTEEKYKARDMRRNNGMSIGEIAKILNVSKSTVSLWVRDIELTDKQKDKIWNKSSDKLRKSILKRYKDKRLHYQNEGKNLAKLYQYDKIFIAGCIMYWAEGSKDRCTASITNSDAEVLKLFIMFLKKYFFINNDKISVFCRYYTDLSDVGEPEEYWIDVLNLQKSCLRKSCVNYYPKSNVMVKRRYSHGKLKYGVCKATVHSVEIKQKIFGAIQGIMGFEKENWSI
tara:strand:- start:682 stop:1365 length:684 start_codon:yes stop_codon:yes gene_type:complete